MNSQSCLESRRIKACNSSVEWLLNLTFLYDKNQDTEELFLIWSLSHFKEIVKMENCVLDRYVLESFDGTLLCYAQNFVIWTYAMYNWRSSKKKTIYFVIYMYMVFKDSARYFLKYISLNLTFISKAVGPCHPIHLSPGFSIYISMFRDR